MASKEHIRATHLKRRKPRVQPLWQRLIKKNKVPKPSVHIFAKIRERQHLELNRGKLTLAQRAARISSRMKSSEMNRKHHGGVFGKGLQLVGPRRHGPGNKGHHHRGHHHGPLSAAQKAHLAYLHKHYHFGKKVK